MNQIPQIVHLMAECSIQMMKFVCESVSKTSPPFSYAFEIDTKRITYRCRFCETFFKQLTIWSWVESLYSCWTTKINRFICGFGGFITFKIRPIFVSVISSIQLSRKIKSHPIHLYLTGIHKNLHSE